MKSETGYGKTPAVAAVTSTGQAVGSESNGLKLAALLHVSLKTTSGATPGVSDLDLQPEQLDWPTQIYRQSGSSTHSKMLPAITVKQKAQTY